MSLESWTESFARQLRMAVDTPARRSATALELMDGIASACTAVYNRGVVVNAELLAATSMVMLHQPSSPSSHCVRGLAMAHAGWDKETSLRMFKNFRIAFPDLRFDPVMHKLMTRQQLVDEYGLYGHVMDDIARSPGAQPYFEALLAGTMDMAVPRRVHHAGYMIMLDEDRQALSFRAVNCTVYGYRANSLGGDFGTPVSQGDVMSYSEASERYRLSTGMEPTFVDDLNPLWTDYEDLAKAGLQLWEPDGKK